MERKEIKNLNDFLNIGCCYLLYSDFDSDEINSIELGEDIVNIILNNNLLIKWYGYFTLGVYDNHQSLLCYITFFDDYVSVDLNTDILVNKFDKLKIIYYLFDNYYYFYE